MKILRYLITWKYEVTKTFIKSYVEFYLLFNTKCKKKIELDEHSLSSYQGMGRIIKETWYDSRLRYDVFSSLKYPDGNWFPLSLLFNEYRCFFLLWAKNERGVKLTPHFPPISRLRMRRSVP